MRKRRHYWWHRIMCFIGKHDWGSNDYWDSDEEWLTCYMCGKDKG